MTFSGVVIFAKAHFTRATSVPPASAVSLDNAAKLPENNTPSERLPASAFTSSRFRLAAVAPRGSLELLRCYLNATFRLGICELRSLPRFSIAHSPPPTPLAIPPQPSRPRPATPISVLTAVATFAQAARRSSGRVPFSTAFLKRSVPEMGNASPDKAMASGGAVMTTGGMNVTPGDEGATVDARDARPGDPRSPALAIRTTFRDPDDSAPAILNRARDLESRVLRPRF